MPLRLRHFFLRGIRPFETAQKLQRILVQEFLSHKALVSEFSRSPSDSPLPQAPRPAIISFSPQPVYTLGRRQHGRLSSEQQKLLLEPLETHDHGKAVSTVATIEPTQRGGQITFHGPGQLVVYPIMDLKPALPYPLYMQGLTVRSYVDLLERSTIRTLAELKVESTTTENPGVWEKLNGREDGPERKIAALGVHLRRNVTSYGVGLNLETDLEWFSRITACGLTGKGVTSIKQIKQERADAYAELWEDMGHANEEEARKEYEQAEPRKDRSIQPSAVAPIWVSAFGHLLGGDASHDITVANISKTKIDEYLRKEDAPD